MSDSVMSVMQAQRRWLVASPDKVPHYINGQKRHGVLDSPDDLAQLASYDEAKGTLAAHPGWHLGFALGPDGTGGHWQGIDFDHVQEKGLADLANTVPGYVERSPSGSGAHAIGYGRHFVTLGSNGTGIEAYAAGRYFTVTEWPIRDGGLVCLAGHVEQVLAPRHGIGRTASASTEQVCVDAKVVTELRSALFHMRADEYDVWYRMGLALKELGDTGRGLWLQWSATSEKFDPKKAERKWAGFEPRDTGYRAVFAEAQKHGWVNPASNAAQPDTVTIDLGSPSPARKLVGRSLAGVAARSIEWLWVGWIPKGYITLFAGETGAGKSTVIGDITARITTGKPWPGEYECPDAWRKPERVLWLGSEDSIEEMTVPRLMACGANLENVIEIQGVTQQGKRNTFSMQDDLEAVSEWLRSARAEGLPFAMLVIDPVTSYLPGQKLRKVDLSDAGQLRTILEPWLRLAQEHNIAIVCVTHFAKDTSRAMLHRVMGSAAFAQTCRSLCAVIEPPATEEYEPGPHEKAMIQVKVNLPEHPGGAWKFSTEKVTVGTDERNGKPITATRPSWDELDTALTPKTAVGPARGPKSRQEPQFAMWLKGLFANKPAGTWLTVDEVKWTAVREGVVSESWWNKHSADHLDKQNPDGTWRCRPKEPPAQKG
ncbi:AAA family ATPase [Sphingobium sp. D43FB]|uniref:AAA family ATPase n=1 Tax=Sphingobium sp. D43FB TaxID=2017595 RepID=UPI001596BCFE|nr:AAA family ATPase [Sphingobium sp. D43FB]